MNLANKTDIDQFVNSLPLPQLNRIFQNYHDYSNLLNFPIITTNKIQKQKALADYLEYFILETDNDERKFILNKIILERNISKLITTICNDQFFEEPLMHILNQNTKYYVL